MTELLDIRGLRVSYGTRGGAATAVDNLDLVVRPGEVVAVVGESGSGKSTTAHAVIGLLPANARVDAGSVRFEGRELAGASDRELRAVRGARIGLVPQDPTVSLNPVTRVGDQVAEVLRVHRLADRRAATVEAVELLERAGLPDPAVRARQYPYELSGGMRQRALIAVAIAARPRLIIADEPTSALDVTVQRRILDHLDDLVRESGAALLLITHDLGIAADRADRVVVMAQGRAVETGPTRTVLDAPRDPYTRRLLAAAPSLSVTDRVAPKHLPDGAALVTVERVTKEFPLPRVNGRSRTVRAVNDVSFDIRRGETFALVGESGSGKSTTARLVLRLTDPTAGRIAFAGADVTRARPGATGAASTGATDLPEPVRLAGPAVHRRRDHHRAATRVRRRRPRVAARPRTRPRRPGRAAVVGAGPAPGAAVGRAAPAGGDRARPGAESRAGRV